MVIWGTERQSMKTLVKIEVENEKGNPSVEDIKLFIQQIIEKGLIGKFDIHDIIPTSVISLRILEIKKNEI